MAQRTAVAPRATISRPDTGESTITVTNAGAATMHDVRVWLVHSDGAFVPTATEPIGMIAGGASVEVPAPARSARTDLDAYGVDLTYRVGDDWWSSRDGHDLPTTSEWVDYWVRAQEE